jgi:transcriptional regulator with XRE-family HTH domain
MLVNIQKLKGKIVEQGLTITSVAEAMGINKATLYRKMENGGAALTIKDANLLVEILHLTAEEAMAIFFAKNVA